MLWVKHLEITRGMEMLKFVKSIEDKAKSSWLASIDWVLYALVDMGETVVKHGITLDSEVETALNALHEALTKEKAKLEAPAVPPVGPVVEVPNV